MYLVTFVIPTFINYIQKLHSLNFSFYCRYASLSLFNFFFNTPSLIVDFYSTSAYDWRTFWYQKDYQSVDLREESFCIHL